MWKKFKSIAANGAFGFMALASTSIPAHAALISLVPESETVAVGSPFTVDVVASLDPADDLASYFIDVIYDGLALDFASVEVSDALGSLDFDAIDVSLPPAVFGDLGVINIAVESFLTDFSSQPDEFLLATLSYTATRPGAVLLEVGDFPALDDPNLIPIEAEAVNAEIAAVPVPSPAYLLSIGAAGLVTVARRRR